MNPKIHIIRISRRVGERKRLVILDETRRRNFHIANPGKEAEKPRAPEEPTTEPPTQGEADAEIEQSKDAKQADEETTETQDLDETESEDKDS